MLIENVDRFRVTEPMFEGIRIVVNHRGETYSPAYIQGISGAAFRMAGICPCARNCSNQMEPTGLLKLLGYQFDEHIIGWVGDVDDAKRNIAEVVPRIKASVRNRKPVLLWYAFADSAFEVVTGYDDRDGSFLGWHMWQTQTDEVARAKQTRAADCVSMFPALGAIFVNKKVGELDAVAAETAALREAVRHAHDTSENRGPGKPPREGLNAYNHWVEDFKKPETKRMPGDSYCLSVYRSTHRAAGLFLNEIAGRHQTMASSLRSAADEFVAEADCLDQAMPLLGWQSPETDTVRNEKVWPMLAEARDHYAKAIGHIEEAMS